MFTTFVGTAAGATESSAPLTPEPQPPKPRQKRSQVARACDWCRVHRIKCDNHLPCSNCRKRNGQCSQGEIPVRTLPHAYRKIERLENRVRELERELENERKAIKPGTGINTPQTPSSLASSGPSGSEGPEAFDSPGEHINSLEGKKSREGVHIPTTRSQQGTWYGASSLFYFIRRMNTFLNTSLQQARPIDRMLPDPVKLFDGTSQTSARDQSSRPTTTVTGDPAIAGSYLTPTQEEYFISLFWQSLHTSLLVLDEGTFKEHYQSLWTTSGRERKPSALVDIVIALCMHYNAALQPGLEDDINDIIAGSRWYYQRCQRLLTNDLENPTILTLQCHLLSSVYLCSASFPNMSDSTCTLAVRTAYMLGLHLEPPEDMPMREREMRKRLLWTLYVFDSKISMKLGRPFQLDHSDTTCSLPGDDRECATLSGSVFAPLGEDATWLTFNLENVKLFRMIRITYTAFYKKQLGTTSIFDDQASQNDPKIIESHAEFLGPYIDRIEDWVKGVPNALKTKRGGNGVPFSTDSTLLEIEQFASLWLQRQRLLLELMYHNLCINLFRPFVRFAPVAGPTPVADKIAADCARHAIALTRILHQVLSSTPILTGWHEASQWQWNAAMSLIGYVIAYPQSSTTPEARSAVDLAIGVFDIWKRSIKTAASAAAITRDVIAQADIFIKQTQENQDSPQKADETPLCSNSWEATNDEALADSNPAEALTAVGDWGYGDGTGLPMQGMLAGSIDMAFTFDNQDFGNFGTLSWPTMNGDPGAQWIYG
ncbi:fungal-specific transcription factor domain-containing protein [Daldinia decipiens]|uniref:fungal-specific transcription factor domain-containing protein n=1 Tax=Daldinia decipiens TaxID=326647 RepID=UPI0020C3ADEC|nr:fungal-specific transcription factor domain-containing protein [Daldinia decipiens]KAI1659347.1 fungal-specific transcription factor domain-containing protein [Daldinia decipiens]